MSRFQVWRIRFCIEWWNWMKPRIEYFHSCVKEKKPPIHLMYIKPQVWDFDKDKMEGINLPIEFGSWRPPVEAASLCVQKWC